MSESGAIGGRLIIFRRRDNLKGTLAERLIGDGIRSGFNSLGDDLVRDLQSQSPNDRGGFRRGHRKRISGAGLRTRMIIVNTVRHAEFVEFGRKPGKQPPPQVMLAYVRRKGIGAKVFSIKTRRGIGAGTRRTFNKATGKRRTASQSLLVIQKSIAFLIGRKIGKFGIKGLFLYRDLKSRNASKISFAMTRIRLRVASLLNS